MNRYWFFNIYIKMDSRYQNGKIYKITSKQTDRVYIGSTIQALNARFGGHRIDCKRRDCFTSKELIKYEDAHIELIENYPCDNKKQLHTRERYYIENTPNVVNKVIPSRTNKEYYQDNIASVKENKKQYYQNNRYSINEKRCEKTDCDCGGRYSWGHKARHLKTQKHLDYINSLGIE